MPASILTKLHKAGPYQVDAARLNTIAVEAAALNYPVLRISSPDSATPAAWWQALAGTLGFPDYFGANFDALLDCLCDKEIMAQDNCVLLLSPPTALGQAERTTLIAVLREAAAVWRADGRRLWSLFANAAPEPDLPLLAER